VSHANAHRAFLEEKFRRGESPFPLWDDVGLRWVDHREGLTVLEIDLGPRHHNPGGIVHGGVVFGLLDTCMGFAATSVLEGPTVTATIEVATSFLRPLTTGRVKAEGRVVRRGRNVIHLEGTCFAPDGEMAARALGAWAVVPKP
jgi:uncharacterized protein (TIGR00369 family)